MNVLIVDDHEPFRTALQALLSASGEVGAVHQAGDGESAVHAAVAHRPDVVLMDLRMPRVDGIAATRRIVARLPQTRVLVLTTFDEDELVRAAIDAGAAGYLLKAMPPEDIIAVMQLAHRGYTTFAPGLGAGAAAKPADPRIDAVLARVARLPERSRAVLELIGQGRTNREIAATLFLALGTVKNHVSVILETLQLRHRTEAAIVARLAHGREPDRLAGAERADSPPARPGPR